MSQHAKEVADAAIQSVPSVTLAGATILGFTLQEVGAIAGCLFILMQGTYLAWKWRGEWLDRKKYAEKLAEPAE